MYILLIFHNQSQTVLNCIWLFSEFKQLIRRTNGIINYNDIQKPKLKYKTSKSFFKVLKVSKKDSLKYFRKNKINNIVKY